jgi:hypothetical protein
MVRRPSGTATEIDYKKRALLRAALAAVVALPIIYLGLNRLFPVEFANCIVWNVVIAPTANK